MPSGFFQVIAQTLECVPFSPFDSPVEPIYRFRPGEREGSQKQLLRRPGPVDNGSVIAQNGATVHYNGICLRFLKIYLNFPTFFSALS